MISLLVALVMCVLIVVIVVFRFFRQGRPPSHLVRVISQSGKKTDYFVGKRKNHKVYFNFWSGDGLGGRYHQVELSGAIKDDFRVIDLRVVFNVEGEQIIPIGKSGNNYFFKQTRLPFDLDQENLTQIFHSFSTVYAFVTDKKVYFRSQNHYVCLPDADPKSIRLAGDEVSGDFLRDDKNFYRYSDTTGSMEVVQMNVPFKK